MVSCACIVCLYISACSDRSVYRIALPGCTTTKWHIDELAYGLSTDRSLHCTSHLSRNPRNKRVLHHGRSIAASCRTMSPFHAVQLTSGQFVVRHGAGDNLIGSDGHVVKSYDGPSDSDTRHVDMFTHLAVDRRTGFVYVADQNNRRALLITYSSPGN